MPVTRQTDQGVEINLRIVPRASKDGIQGVLGDALKIRLCAPPVDGKANRALVEFLAETLDVPPSRVAILSGETGRSKRVLIAGAAEGDVRARLQIT